MSRRTALFFVVLILVFSAVFVLAFTARRIAPTEASCKAVGGTMDYDHDGARCMKHGVEIDPNDEAAP